jgi:2-polyprenyl-6-methoxyphenol hydroxylase-like FAD-dependent oxidoreductase
MTEVLIVGAGPAGLLLAGELRLAGVDTVVIERQSRRPDFCRSFTLNARSLDLLARRGLADGLIGEGWPAPHAPHSGLPVTLSLAGTHTDHPYTLGIPQTRVEEVLEAHALDLGADIRRGHRLRTLEQDAASVTAVVETPDGEDRIRAAYLVGCDGGRSTVRKQAGIAFPGTEATRFSLLGDVEFVEPEALPYGVTAGPAGAVFVIPRPGYVRVITADPHPPADKYSPVTLDLLQAAVDQALGRHVELHAARWLTRFDNAARQATRYVQNRVILAGDAAHIHPPAGAIGINVALDDAFNLGWKLAATVRGTAPSHLLDSYHDERHAAGARVLANTRAQTLLGEGAGEADDRLAPLTDLLTRVATHPSGNRAFAEIFTGLDTRYDMHPDADHPWLGRLAPNLTLTAGTDGTDVATLLATGRGLLLDLTDGIRESATGFADRLDIVDTTCPDHPELRAMLLRPDGHIAWLQTSGHDTTGTLPQALQHWYGPPASVHSIARCRRPG